MEQTKYLEPKLSYSFDDLTSLLKQSESYIDSSRLSKAQGIDKLNIKSIEVQPLVTSPVQPHKQNITAKNIRRKLRLAFIDNSDSKLSEINDESEHTQRDQIRNAQSNK